MASHSTTALERADSAHSFDFPTVRNPRPGCQSDKVSVNSTTKDGILGVSGRFSDTASNIPSREAEEDPTVGTTPPSPTEGLSERCGKVCGQSLSIHKSNMASPIALQSTAVSDQLSDSREPWPNRACNYEIQCQLESNQGGREQPKLVDIPGPESANTIPNIVSNIKYDNRVRCLQQGLGSPTRRTEHWGEGGHRKNPHTT